MSGEVERSKLVKLADDILRLSPEERNQLFNIIKLDKLDKFSQENFEKIIEGVEEISHNSLFYPNTNTAMNQIVLRYPNFIKLIS